MSTRPVRFKNSHANGERRTIRLLGVVLPHGYRTGSVHRNVFGKLDPQQRDVRFRTQVWSLRLANVRILGCIRLPWPTNPRHTLVRMPCCANGIPANVTEDSFHGVGLVACERIPRDTEICWHYGESYTGLRDYPVGDACAVDTAVHPPQALGHPLPYTSVCPMLDSPSASSDELDDPWRLACTGTSDVITVKSARGRGPQFFSFFVRRMLQRP